MIYNRWRWRYNCRTNCSSRSRSDTKRAMSIFDWRRDSLLVVVGSSLETFRAPIGKTVTDVLKLIFGQCIHVPAKSEQMETNTSADNRNNKKAPTKRRIMKRSRRWTLILYRSHPKSTPRGQNTVFVQCVQPNGNQSVLTCVLATGTRRRISQRWSSKQMFVQFEGISEKQQEITSGKWKKI